MPALTWSILAMLAAYRFLAPGYKTGNTTTTTTNNTDTTDTRSNDSKTRKVANMGAKLTWKLAEAALIVALFNTVGISALSL